MTTIFPMSAHPCSSGPDGLLHGAPSESANRTLCDKPVHKHGMQVTGVKTVCPKCSVHQAGLDECLTMIAHSTNTAD